MLNLLGTPILNHQSLCTLRLKQSLVDQFISLYLLGILNYLLVDTFQNSVTYVIIIIITIIIIISFMLSTYIPDTNYVPREHSVAAILLFLCTIHGAYIVSYSVESIVLLH